MAWPKFGKSEEKNDQTKSEADELVERFAALIEEKNKPLNEMVTSLKSKFEAIEAEALKTPEAPPRDPATITDEERRDGREKALFALSVQANARITEADCIAELAGQWSHLIPDFRRMAAETPIEVKANPNYAKMCQNAVDQLIGKAARAGGVRSDASGKFFIEDSASKTGGEESPLNDIPAWQGDDRVESASETLAKLKIDPKKFSDDFKSGRLN